MKTILKFTLLCVVFGTYMRLAAQEIRWQNPQQQLFHVVQGQLPLAALKDRYQRLPDQLKSEVRTPVWDLSQQNAGIYLEFATDAIAITVRYTVEGELDMPHMPATGVSGVDLYGKNKNGRWDWAAGSYAFGDTITYRFNNLAIGDQEKLRLYLPLYNSVSWMEIGVDADARFEFIPPSNEKPIVVYGTSIAQGACASRPGLAWTSILGRQLDLPIINLGFSGNGRLEQPLIHLIGEVDARLFVLDCMPNLTRGSIPESEIKERIVYAVEYLQKQHPKTPILLVEHSVGTSEQLIDTARNANYNHTSDVMQTMYRTLKDRGVNGIYLLTGAEIGIGTESTVDGIHPNDIGMMEHARAYREAINNILEN